MTAPRPLDWIQEIEASLVELDEKPQFGLPALLDWEQLEKELQQLLNRPHIKLSHTLRGWVTADELFAGLGRETLPLSIELSPIKIPAFFVTDQQNLKELMAYVFGDDSNFFYESSYVQGFYTYFASEMLRLIEKQKFSSPLTPRLGPDIERIRDKIGEESCFVIDISLSLDGKNFWGRLLLSANFRSAWKAYFSHLGPPPLSDEMKEKIMVAIGLEIAHTRLKMDEWKKVQKGDIVVLDHCSYDPTERKGSVVLTLNQKPVFRGRFKDEGIKITNYPIYEEVSEAMEDEPFEKSIEPDDEDEDLYGDFGEDDDSEFDEDDDDEDLFEELEPKEKEPTKEEAVKKPEVTKLASPSEEKPPISTTELPVLLTVEVGRLRMSVGALMAITPGNLLELNVSPEQGVDLLLNGKKVGRGELVRMGDVLGVRVLSL